MMRQSDTPFQQRVVPDKGSGTRNEARLSVKSNLIQQEPFRIQSSVDRVNQDGWFWEPDNEEPVYGSEYRSRADCWRRGVECRACPGLPITGNSEAPLPSACERCAAGFL